MQDLLLLEAYACGKPGQEYVITNCKHSKHHNQLQENKKFCIYIAKRILKPRFNISELQKNKHSRRTLHGLLPKFINGIQVLDFHFLITIEKVYIFFMFIQAGLNLLCQYYELQI